MKKWPEDDNNNEMRGHAMSRLLIAAIPALALAACNQPTPDAAEPDSDAPTIEFTPAAVAETPEDKPKPVKQIRLHPVKEACITYEMTGEMMSGTTTRCHRKWAFEQYEIQDFSVGFGGFTQAQKSHSITIGDTIYAIDVEAGTGTKTTNPMYADLVEEMKDADVDDMTTAFISALGMQRTDQTKTIANTKCRVYQSQQMGTVCMTDDGLMLETVFMGMGQIATSVKKGDGGDSANYELYKKVTITDGPDLSQGLEGLMEQLGTQ